MFKSDMRRLHSFAYQGTKWQISKLIIVVFLLAYLIDIASFLVICFLNIVVS